DTTGFIKQVDIEPTDTGSLRLIRDLTPDSRGRLQTVKETAVATGEARTTGFTYDSPDGAYVTLTTDAVGNTRRVWRHPGFGFGVEIDDANSIPAAWSYDTLGRLLSETAASGASTTLTYSASLSPYFVSGADVQVLPEGKSSRQISVHLDAFGNELF